MDCEITSDARRNKSGDVIPSRPAPMAVPFLPKVFPNPEFDTYLRRHQ
jgi:hypothetical protein